MGNIEARDRGTAHRSGVISETWEGTSDKNLGNSKKCEDFLSKRNIYIEEFQKKYYLSRSDIILGSPLVPSPPAFPRGSD
ncbi:unnamed protein product [Allacma fusca]|uniref:Uncharacterized protein n=1 Tax=Allacma fusca TaxID=39272 RepID=A0A8J2KXW3_9HEXA|nr:unnamed protein product [Allacma fusca]